MDKNQKLELIKDEYFKLQEFYEDVDKRALTIKGWDITVSLTAIGAGFLLNPYLWLASALATAVFWYLEAFWRNYHFFLGARIKQIEAAIRDDNLKDIIPLQIYSTWTTTFNEKGSQTFRYLFKPVTLFPHLLIFIVFIGLFIIWYFGIIEAPIKVN